MTSSAPVIGKWLRPVRAGPSSAWKSSNGARIALGLLGIVAFLSLWQISSKLEIIDPVLLPPVEIVVQAFVQNWTEPDFLHSAYATEIAATIARMLIGFIAAAASGVFLGVLIGLSSWLSTRLNLTLTLVCYLPPAVIVPIALLFLGKSNETVLAVIVFSAFWPILLNTIDGVRSAEPLLLDVARIYKYRAVDVATKIVLPLALPQILAGMRLAVSVCLLAAVVAEMLGGSDGLGYLILIGQRTFEYREMYGGILLLGALGVLANLLFRVVERKMLHWHPIGREGQAT